MYAVVQTGVGMDFGDRFFLSSCFSSSTDYCLVKLYGWEIVFFSYISMFMSLTSNSSSFWLVVVDGSTMWMPLFLFFTELYLKLLYLLSDADAMFENTILFPSVLCVSVIVAWNSCCLEWHSLNVT